MEFLDPEGRVQNPERVKELVFRGVRTPVLTPGLALGVTSGPIAGFTAGLNLSVGRRVSPIP